MIALFSLFATAAELPRNKSISSLNYRNFFGPQGASSFITTGGQNAIHLRKPDWHWRECHSDSVFYSTVRAGLPLLRWSVPPHFRRVPELALRRQLSVSTARVFLSAGDALDALAHPT
jgi:hypothetical protein